MRSQQYLEINLKQHTALNRLQYQSLRLLQYSATELMAEIDQAIIDNPLLEKVDFADLASSQKIDKYWLDVIASRHVDDIPEQPASTSLSQHLAEQLGTLNISPVLRQLVLLLVAELDEDGYLAADLSWSELNQAFGIDVESGLWQQAVNLLQSFDPPGVGARDLAESLKIQLLRHSSDEKIIDAAIKLTANLADVAAGNWVKLAKSLTLDQALLKQAYQLIQSLNPRPAANWQIHEPIYIVPDGLVYKSGDDWHISLNPMLGNAVCLSPSLTKITGADLSADMQEKLQQAKNLLRNIGQRSGTLLQLMHYLVRHQNDFLEYGPQALVPLKLSDVAKDLGLHVSTVSRACRLKYIQTPQGLISIKTFFTNGIAAGENIVSSQAIQKTIADLIGNETQAQPLSDADISKLLHQKGIQISRRTVAKYRSDMGFKPSYRRKN